MLTYTTIPIGMLESNSYILKDEASGALALIDCCAFNKALRTAIEAAGGDLRYILLTHGHFDHIQGVAHAKEAYPQAIVAIGEADAPYLRGEIDTMPGRVSRHKNPTEPDILLRDGDEIKFGESTLRVIACPGHTPGGVCFHSAADKLLFTGDTLFREEVGRADLVGSNWDDLVASIKNLYTIHGDCAVLPGHGEASSLAHERVHNAWVKA